MKKVSVILPAYNCENTIDLSIKSIISQSYSNKELIIINDGSTDCTKEKIEKYRKYKWIHIINTDNNGVSNARNFGISVASGDYIMFIDSDDTYEFNMIEVMVKNITKEDSDICCCNYNLLSNNIIKKTCDLNDFVTSNQVKYISALQKKSKFNSIWSKIYKKEIIERYNIVFDANLDMAEDYMFNINYCVNSKKLKYINCYLYNYNITSDGLSSKYRYNDFERNLNNNNIILDLYKAKGLPVETIYKQYIEITIESIVSVLLSKNCRLKLKDKLKKVKYYLDQIDIDSIKKKYKTFNFSYYKKICYFLMKKRHIILLYCIVFIKNKIFR